MRYRLRAEVDGLLYLPTPNERFTAEKDGNVFVIEAGPDRRATHISVSVPVPVERVRHHSATLSMPDADGRQSKVTLTADPEVHEAAESLLQEFESVFAVLSGSLSVSRIRWLEAQSSLVPESEDEKARVQFWDLSVKRESFRQRALLSEDAFRGYVDLMGRYDYLVALMGFYHEGVNRQDAGAYLQAFHAFYFVFEGLYGNGRSSKPELLRAFAEHPECVAVSQRGLDHFAALAARPPVAFRSLMAQDGYAWDVNGLHGFIVDMRGRLHHMPSKPPRDGVQPNPFKQDRAEALSFFMSYVSHLGLMYRIIPINRRHAGLPVD